MSDKTSLARAVQKLMEAGLGPPLGSEPIELRNYSADLPEIDVRPPKPLKHQDNTPRSPKQTLKGGKR